MYYSTSPPPWGEPVVPRGPGYPAALPRIPAPSSCAHGRSPLRIPLSRADFHAGNDSRGYRATIYTAMANFSMAVKSPLISGVGAKRRVLYVSTMGSQKYKRPLSEGLLYFWD